MDVSLIEGGNRECMWKPGFLMRVLDNGSGKCYFECNTIAKKLAQLTVSRSVVWGDF